MSTKLSAALVAMSLVAVAQPASVQAEDKILMKPSTTVKPTVKPFVSTGTLEQSTPVEDATRGVYTEPPEGLDSNFQELKRGGYVNSRSKPSKSDQKFIQMIKDKKAAAAAKKPQ